MHLFRCVSNSDFNTFEIGVYLLCTNTIDLLSIDSVVSTLSTYCQYFEIPSASFFGIFHIHHHITFLFFPRKVFQVEVSININARYIMSRACPEFSSNFLPLPTQWLGFGLRENIFRKSVNFMMMPFIVSMMLLTLSYLIKFSAM